MEICVDATKFLIMAPYGTLALAALSCSRHGEIWTSFVPRMKFDLEPCDVFVVTADHGVLVSSDLGVT